MSDDLVFYTHPMSRGRIVRWMLEEVGQPYRTELLGYGTSMKAADYLGVNPMGKVPAIRHGDTVVTECAAICTYLADAFPEAGLAPPHGDRARGPYYRWLFFAAGPLEQAAIDRARKIEVTPDQSRMVGYGTFDAVIDALDGMLADREYIAGGRFSAADVYVGSHLLWGSQFGWLPQRSSFDTYMVRLRERPAYARANDKDNALMAEAAPA